MKESIGVDSLEADHVRLKSPCVLKEKKKHIGEEFHTD